MRSTPKKTSRKPEPKAPKKRGASLSKPAPKKPLFAFQRKKQAADEALTKEIGKIASDIRDAKLRDALDPWEIFLECVRKLPDRGTALSTAGLSRKALSDRLREDPAFDKLFKQAFDDGLDSMEDEVVRRAVLGVDEPVYQGGMLVGHKTKYSDTLLMFFLEASRKKFRSGDAEIRRPLSDEAKSTLRQIFQDVSDEAEIVAPKAAAAKKRGRPKGST